MNWTLITVAIIAAFPATLTAIITLIYTRRNAAAIQEVHLSINSRMTELLKASKGESKAEGVEIGRKEVR